jgi:cytochrome c oxidase subunit 2
MMMKKWLFASMLLFAVLLLSACGGSEESSTPEENVSEESMSEESSMSEDAGSTAQVVNISATNFAFNQEEYRVSAGAPISIEYASAQGVHGIAITGTDITLNDGDKKEVTLEAGEYDIICTIPCGTGHAQMRAKLIVEA